MFYNKIGMIFFFDTIVCDDASSNDGFPVKL